MRIGATEMDSESTEHTAKRVLLRNGEVTWRVSWLPGHDLSQNEAVTAMTLAEAIGTRPFLSEADPIWFHIEGWAAELGMGTEAAMLGVRTPPDGERQEQPQHQG